jgi:hypothetical protein
MNGARSGFFYSKCASDINSSFSFSYLLSAPISASTETLFRKLKLAEEVEEELVAGDKGRAKQFTKALQP